MNGWQNYDDITSVLSSLIVKTTNTKLVAEKNYHMQIMTSGSGVQETLDASALKPIKSFSDAVRYYRYCCRKVQKSDSHEPALIHK